MFHRGSQQKRSVLPALLLRHRTLLKPVLDNHNLYTVYIQISYIVAFNHKQAGAPRNF